MLPLVHAAQNQDIADQVTRLCEVLLGQHGPFFNASTRLDLENWERCEKAKSGKT